MSFCPACRQFRVIALSCCMLLWGTHDSCSCVVVIHDRARNMQRVLPLNVHASRPLCNKFCQHAEAAMPCSVVTWSCAAIDSARNINITKQGLFSPLLTGYQLGHASHATSHALILCHAGTESWRQVVQVHDSSAPASEDHLAAMCQQSISSAQVASQFQHINNANAITPEELDASGVVKRHAHTHFPRSCAPLWCTG